MQNHITECTQVAVNNHDKFGEVTEGLAEIAEIICRHAILEDLYCGRTSIAAGELQRALVVLYATVLQYLSKARAYLKQGSIGRSADLFSWIMAKGFHEQNVCSRVDFYPPQNLTTA